MSFFKKLRKVYSLIAWTIVTIKGLRLLPAKRDAENLKKQFVLTHRWGDGIFKTLGMKVEVKGEVFCSEPAIFVGNHISYFDIPLLLAYAPITFVAKKEIDRWPLIGTGCRLINVIFVDRSSVESRKNTLSAIGKSILEKQQSIVIFPSGTTSLTDHKRWKTGAFQIAKEHGIPVQQFHLSYEPVRETAFVDDDAMVPSLWKVLGLKSLRCELEFLPPVSISDPMKDSQRMWEKSRSMTLEKQKRVNFVASLITQGEEPQSVPVHFSRN